MFSNEKLRLYIFAFLAFCVVSSKHIIIYNEEILVALSFFSFVFFVAHYFGNNIKESLDERSQSIKLELQNFLSLKQQSLEELFKEHQKVKNLKQALSNVGDFTHHELIATNSALVKGFDLIIFQQVQQKLKNLFFSKMNLQQKFQPLLASNILPAVLVKMQKSKKQGNKGPSAFQETQLNQKSISRIIQLLIAKN